MAARPRLVTAGDAPRPVIHWFRADLRLADNQGLTAALARAHGAPLVPVFIWAPEEEEPFAPGAASRVWLQRALGALDESLRRLGSRLIIRRGPTLDALGAVADECGASAVHWNRRYEPAFVSRDAHIKEALRARGLAAESAPGALLREPWTLSAAGGGPLRVFTPFWRRLCAAPPDTVTAPAPTTLPAPPVWPDSLPLAALELTPRIPWDAGIHAAFTPGEAGARAALERFVAGPAAGYAVARDRPDLEGVSRLSPHLHFGEVSPRQVWAAVEDAADARGFDAAPFLRQLVWREFAAHLLFHFPHTAERALQSSFDGFPWRDDPRALAAWQRGQTGYPIVDAGMRELWTTGYMHNRVRMIVASFLVKDLLLPWQLGAAWFWDTLVDADLANNALGWQWCAGSGADAAPYFRIFNPVLQGRRFDPRGVYVRRWLPELASLSEHDIHAPWDASPDSLRAASVEIGDTYPMPIVDHAMARQRALAALATTRAPAKAHAKPSGPRTRAGAGVRRR